MEYSFREVLNICARVVVIAITVGLAITAIFGPMIMVTLWLNGGSYN